MRNELMEEGEMENTKKKREGNEELNLEPHVQLFYFFKALPVA